MADEELFGDTAADAGGNGTTRNHSSGDSAHAYASYAAFESGHGTTNLVSEDITMRVRMAGSAADGTIDIGSSWGMDATRFLTIESDDAAPDSDGKYGGPLVWSASHYRVEEASGFRALRTRSAFVRLIGLQLQCTRNNSGAHGIEVARNDVLIDSCSITAAGNTLQAGVWGNSGDSRSSFTLQNSNVFDIVGTGVLPGAIGSAARTSKTYNDTIFDCTTGIGFGVDDADLTYVNKNNTLYNNTTNIVTAPSLATWTHSHNALDDGIYDTETGGVDMTSTVTDDMVDPENATMKSRDVTPKSTGALFEAGIGSGSDANVPILDIFGTTRDTTSPSIGAIETLAAAGGGLFMNQRNLDGMGVGGPFFRNPLG